MTDDENLRSKYERLCIEFKRLRTKHKALKDSIAESAEKDKKVKETLDEKDTYIQKLVEEAKILSFRNEYLAKQTEFLQGQLIKTDENVGNKINVDHVQSSTTAQSVHNLELKGEAVPNNSQIFDENKQSDWHSKSETTNLRYSDAKNCSDLHVQTLPIQTEPTEVLDSKSVQTLCQTNVCLIDNQSTDSMSDSNLDLSHTTTLNNNIPSPTLMKPISAELAFQQDMNRTFFENFTEALNDWIRNLRSVRENIKSDLSTVLTQQIVNLESKLCELTVELQIERKRRLIEKKNSDMESDKYVSNSVEEIVSTVKCDNKSNHSEQDSLSKESLLKKRLSLALDEAHYFAGHANLLQDELESLLPWIVQLTRLNYQQCIQLSRIHDSKAELQTQLELTRLRTAKQINEMASHIANMTDELQSLRSPNHNTSSPIQSIKSSIFHVLKK